MKRPNSSGDCMRSVIYPCCIRAGYEKKRKDLIEWMVQGRECLSFGPIVEGVCVTFQPYLSGFMVPPDTSYLFPLIAFNIALMCLICNVLLLIGLWIGGVNPDFLPVLCEVRKCKDYEPLVGDCRSRVKMS